MSDLGLKYWAHGIREYPSSHKRIYPRGVWEYQSVVSGEIGIALFGGDVQFRTKTLWVIAPDCAHDWVSAPGSISEVVVFHLPEPDPLLQAEVRQVGGALPVPLQPGDLEWLREEVIRMRPHYQKPNRLTPIEVRRLLDGLTLLALNRIRFDPEDRSGEVDRERVEAAEYWMARNLTRHPTVRDVAEAIGVSAVHLRRLFHAQNRPPPGEVLQELRLRRGEQRLHEGGWTLEEIADELGYAGPSSFSRAFRTWKGCSPGDVRRLANRDQK